MSNYTDNRKKVKINYICAEGVNKEGKGQCFPLGSKQANNIPKSKQTNCNVFPNTKCQERDEYIETMLLVLKKKLDYQESLYQKLQDFLRQLNN